LLFAQTIQGIGTDTDLTIGPLHPKPIKYHLTSVT
jgi:hypothetical protein